MNGLKNLATSGWHPNKSGQKESWRGDFKGINQIAGWVGKTKSSSASSPPAQEHRSTPLSKLQDPDKFGPPPKNVRYYGGQSSSVSRGPNATQPVQFGVARREPSPEPQKEDLGAVDEPPMEQEPLPAPSRTLTTESVHEAAPRLPPRRFNTDGTGQGAAPPAGSGKPALPPRLPPRPSTTTNVQKVNPPDSGSAPARDGADITRLNRDALDSLGKAGVSVPGFDIGARSGPPAGASASRGEQTRGVVGRGAESNQIQQLSSRFSTPQPASSAPAADDGAPSTGTTFAQKQAAIRTISNLQKNPASVSLADAKTAASTANNFRQRHGAQVAQGLTAANEINNRYAVSARLGSQMPPPYQETCNKAADSPRPAGQSGKKPPPPPPPPKRRELVDAVNAGVMPPPLSLANKPR